MSASTQTVIRVFRIHARPPHTPGVFLTKLVVEVAEPMQSLRRQTCQAVDIIPASRTCGIPAAFKAEGLAPTDLDTPRNLRDDQCRSRRIGCRKRRRTNTSWNCSARAG